MSDGERSGEARAVAERALTQLLAGGAPISELPDADAALLAADAAAAINEFLDGLEP